MPLDFAGGHPTSIEGNELIIKARAAGLTLGDDNRLDPAVAVARHLNRQLAKFALYGFRRLAIACIAALVASGAMLFVSRVARSTPLPAPAPEALCELFEQTGFPNRVLGFLLVGK
jgi:hypothetical protein